MATPFPFGSGNVLTAAQLNAITTLPVSTKTASYVLTVADLGTRVVMNSASATTITVNTSIFGASDKVEILNIGTGVCTVTAGTCTVGTTGSLALAQNGGGTLTFISASASVFTASASLSGLTLVTPTSTANTGGTVTVTGGKVNVAGSSSVSLNGVFTSTFQNYMVLLDTFQSSSGTPAVTLRLRVAGTDTTSGTYTFGQVYGLFTGSTGGGGSTSATSFAIFAANTTQNQSTTLQIFAPQAATRTTYSSMGLAHDALSMHAGFQSDSTQFDGFTIIIASGNYSGNITVYGYQKS